MEIAFRKTEFPCMVCAVREIQNTELTQELRLQDGMPDVGKVVCAWGQPIVRSKEWRSDSFVVSGGMLMWVLYAPEDGSEHRVVNGWLPFQMRWQLPENTGEGTIRVDALTRFADARSVSPRKLMLRCGIGVQAEAWTPVQMNHWEPPQIPDSIELLKRRYPVRLPVEAGEKAFALDEDLPSASAQGTLLYYAIHPEITEQKVVGDKIAFRGNANLHAVFCGQDGAVNAQDYPLPFSQFAELKQSYGPDAQGSTVCCVTNVEVEPGENGSCRVRGGIAAQFLVDDLRMVDSVEDAYAPGMQLRVEQQLLELPAVLEKRMDTVSAECSADLADAQVVDFCFLPDFPRQYRENGKLILEIPGTVQSLCRSLDGLRCISSRWEGRMELPVDENAAVTVFPMLPPAPQLTYGGNQTIRAELPLRIVTDGGQGIPVVTELEQGSEAEPDPHRPSIILRRAGADSLWEIAKKCGSTMDAIRKANNLQEEPGANQLLLIPVC